MGTGRRRSGPEFKQEAVRLVMEGEKESKVAADLGISAEVLRRWKQQVVAAGPKAFPGHGKVRSENAELVALRRENKILREERDILENATAFFDAYEKRGSR